MRFVALAILFLLECACSSDSNHASGDSALAARRANVVAARDSGVPAYLLPVFHAFDSVLTPGQRDTLRSTSVDSAFTYRTSRLGPSVDSVAATWYRTPAWDTLRAHGETLPGVQASILLDLYQQHLRDEPLDLAGALHRMSPDYVRAYDTVVSVDSVLFDEDLDGSGGADRLVREARRKQGDEEGSSITHRLALYLDAAPASKSPAWASVWSEFDFGALSRPLHVPEGGALLAVTQSGGDGEQQYVIDAFRGTAREVLQQDIDDGDGDFSIRGDSGRIVVTATGDVRLPGRTISPSNRCAAEEWRASVLAFNPSSRAFVLASAKCITRR